MATPLLLYKLDQAASGTTPTNVNDTSAGTALNLPISYGTATAWTSIAAGDGINFDGTGSAVSASLSATKVATALAGATKCTLEFVVNTSSASNFKAIGGIQSNAFDDICDVSIGGASAQISFNWTGGAVAFDCPLGLRHIMVVLDTTQASSTNRILAYIDGSAAAVNSLPTPPTYPALNAALDAGFTNWANNRFSLGCLTNAAGNPFTGPIYFAAMYAAALTSADAAAHSAALLANNDADPNAGTVAQAPFRRRAMDLSAWDVDDQPAPRRRVSPVAMPAVATRIPFRRQAVDLSQFYEPTYYWLGLRSALVQTPPAAQAPGFTRPWLATATATWEPEERYLVRSRTLPPPVAPAPVRVPFARRWMATALETWVPVDIWPVVHLELPPPVAPTPPIPPPAVPSLMPGWAMRANQTTGTYDPNIALAFLLSVQDSAGNQVATNTFVAINSPFNDYALATAGLLGPVRTASGRDLRLVKDIIGQARRLGASNTPYGSTVQYPHLIGAMGLSFQMVGLMDESGATYANVESAAQTGGVYRYPPAGFNLKGSS